jgi:hypothetical protein
MKTIEVSEKLYHQFMVVDGRKMEEKLHHLLRADIFLKLKECEDTILKFEARYGMSFAHFKAAWEKGQISQRFSHPVERDYMEWEGFESERKQWLKSLKKLLG